MAAVALAREIDGLASEQDPAPGGARSPLRIGVFADSRLQPRWSVDGLRKVVDAGIGEVLFVAETGRAGDASPLLWRAYCAIDSRLFGSHPDPLESTDLAASLPRARVLTLPRGDAGPASAGA